MILLKQKLCPLTIVDVMAPTIIAVLEDWSNIYVHHEAPLEQSNFFRWLWWSSAVFLTMALLEQYNLFEH